MNTHPNPPPLFVSCAPLVLASGSPRRQHYFHELGLDFKVQVADIDEQHLENENPEEFVKRLAQEKARVVGKFNDKALVVGADTVVVMGEKILGKPLDRADALQMLKTLQGQWHEVWTGFSVCNLKQNIAIHKAVRTGVRFWQHPIGALKAYVETGEPFDKAGAYGIQGKGCFLVQEISGSYSNVVGLPLAELIEVLLRIKAIKPAI